MNAPLPIPTVPTLNGDHPVEDAAAPRLREIPYNYTSLSDREIVSLVRESLQSSSKESNP